MINIQFYKKETNLITITLKKSLQQSEMALCSNIIHVNSGHYAPEYKGYFRKKVDRLEKTIVEMKRLIKKIEDTQNDRH